MNEENTNLMNDEENANNTSKLSEGKTFSSKEAVIDQILNQYGYGYTTWKFISLTFSILMIEGLEMTLFGSMIIPLSKKYQLSGVSVKLISSIIFIGVGLGSFSVGWVSTKAGRPTILKLLLIVLCICHTFMSLFENIIIFTIFRFFIGYLQGILTPISLNLLTENLPMKMRAFILTSVWIGFTIGQGTLLIIMLGVMPEMEIEKVRLTLLLSTVVPLFSLIYNLIFLQDSPRNLITRGNDEEALIQLEKLHGKPLSENLKLRIVNELRSGIQVATSDFGDLFNEDFRRTTFLLIFIWAINSTVLNGPILTTSLTIQKLGGATGSTSNKSIIVKQIIIAFTGIPMMLLGGVLTELAFLGRKKAALLSCVVSSLFIICSVIFSSSFALIIGFGMSCLAITLNITISYSCEVYPTKIRDKAIGFLFFFNRMGGFLSQILYVWFNDIQIFFPYYFTVALIGLGFFLIISLPYETFGQPLDIKKTDVLEKPLEIVSEKSE